MGEVDDAPGPVDQGHPDLRPHLLWRRPAVRVVDPRRLDAAPHVLLALRPTPEAIDTQGDVPEVAGDLLLLVAGRVDVEGGDVAALEVPPVVLRVVGPH